jgi:hypothetical protein
MFASLYRIADLQEILVTREAKVLVETRDELQGEVEVGREALITVSERTLAGRVHPIGAGDTYGLF